MSCDTIYITTYNGADLFRNFNEIYKCKHDFHGLIKELIRSFYNCTDKTAEALRYGFIKYNVKDDDFIVFDKNRTNIYDSRIGFMDLKTLSSKDELENDEIDKLIDYIKPLMNSATNNNTIYKNNYIFYFIKLHTSKGIKIQNDLLTKEKVFEKGRKYLGWIAWGIGLLLAIYSFMKTDPTVKIATRVATQTNHFINRTGSLINSAWGNKRLQLWQSMAKHGKAWTKSHGRSPMKSNLEHEFDEVPWTNFSEYDKSSPLPWIIQEEYNDEETETLGKKGVKI